MLEKNEKNEQFSYFDAHFHYSECVKNNFFEAFDNIHACSCFHSPEEWDIWSAAASELSSKIQASYGLHPQSAAFIDLKKSADFLQSLLEKKQLSAIGEAGFDYFTKDFLQQEKKQEEMWNIQLELALAYRLPLVVHCRKANHKLFEYSKQLKKLPSILFHSFMGPPTEAFSLLNRGINAYFSFGKQLMNNNKKVIACVKELPLEKLLCETDAPYQFLKNEKGTYNYEIKKVYDQAFSLRSDSASLEAFAQAMERNYSNLFIC